MRQTNRWVILLLAVILSVAFWSGSAHAAYECYATIEGAKQGKFKGEGPGRNTGRIPCLQFSYELKPQREAAPGQASGKKQPQPIVIVKETGSASPQLFQALTTHELLRHVTFEFVRLSADGREEVYKTLRLTNATVASIRQLAGGDKGPHEEVTFVFQQLEATGADGKPVPIEHWTGIQK